MLSGFYTIASGLLARQREQDVIGNNLINAQTPGYRTDRQLITSFEQELMTRSEAYGNTTVLGTGIGATEAIVGDVIPLLHSGNVKQTGRECDVAIGGEGYFNIQSDNGERYLTRNGQFDMDDNGYLTLPGIGRVVGKNGYLQVGKTGFHVDQSGDVYNSDGGLVGSFLITTPALDSALIKTDNGMFQLEAGVQANVAGGYALMQNNIELSNVDMNQELTLLMESQRAFQTCSSALQMIDAMNRKAATQLAAM